MRLSLVMCHWLLNSFTDIYNIMTMSSVLLCGSTSFYRLKSVEIELKMLTFSCRPSCLTVSHFIALKQSIRKGSVCSIQNPLHHDPTAESKLRSQETHGITDHHRIKMCSPHCRTQLLNILLLLPVLTLSLFIYNTQYTNILAV